MAQHQLDFGEWKGNRICLRCMNSPGIRNRFARVIAVLTVRTLLSNSSRNRLKTDFLLVFGQNRRTSRVSNVDMHVDSYLRTHVNCCQRQWQISVVLRFPPYLNGECLMFMFLRKYQLKYLPYLNVDLDWV